jgi:hypothetical protein
MQGTHTCTRSRLVTGGRELPVGEGLRVAPAQAQHHAHTVDARGEVLRDIQGEVVGAQVEGGPGTRQGVRVHTDAVDVQLERQGE